MQNLNPPAPNQSVSSLHGLLPLYPNPLLRAILFSLRLFCGFLRPILPNAGECLPCDLLPPNRSQKQSNSQLRSGTSTELLSGEESYPHDPVSLRLNQWRLGMRPSLPSHSQLLCVKEFLLFLTLRKGQLSLLTVAWGWRGTLGRRPNEGRWGLSEIGSWPSFPLRRKAWFWLLLSLGSLLLAWGQCGPCRFWWEWYPVTN